MTNNFWLTVALVVTFIAIGAVFSGTELAVMSLRESQIVQLAESGKRGRRAAAIARDPNRFLATVQIGVTLCDFLSAAFGASVLAPAVTPYLVGWGVSETVATPLAFFGFTILIVYCSLIFGELVPKRIAVQRATQISSVMAGPIEVLATILTPVIWFLGKSTNGVLRVLGSDPTAHQEEIDEAELRSIIAGQDQMADDERRILSDVITAADRTVAEAMTPRGEVAWLPASYTLAEAAEKIRDLPYSRYPVIGRNFDDVLGFVHVRDVLQPPVGSDPLTTRVHAVKRPIMSFPSTNRAIASMSILRQQGSHLAVVVDEYGGTDGIVTLEDLVEELVGDIRDEYDRPEAELAAGVYDAGLTIEEFDRLTGEELEDGYYETVAGYILARLGRLAVPGDSISLPNGGRLTVADVKDLRIRAVSLTLPTVPVVADEIKPSS
jgi:putative hemolysin